MVRGVGRRGVKKRSAGSSGIVISCRCVGSGGVGKGGQRSFKRGKTEAPCTAFLKFFVGEARTDWDFGFSMAFSTLL